MYKTIVLELLQQRPALREQLRKTRELMPTLKDRAAELKTRHQAWIEALRQRRPKTDPSQLSSEAMEMAIEEMKGHLSDDSPSNESEAL